MPCRNGCVGVVVYWGYFAVSRIGCYRGDEPPKGRPSVPSAVEGSTDPTDSDVRTPSPSPPKFSPSGSRAGPSVDMMLEPPASRDSDYSRRRESALSPKESPGRARGARQPTLRAVAAAATAMNRLQRATRRSTEAELLDSHVDARASSDLPGSSDSTHAPLASTAEGGALLASVAHSDDELYSVQGSEEPTPISAEEACNSNAASLQQCQTAEEVSRSQPAALTALAFRSHVLSRSLPLSLKHQHQ